MGLPLVIDQPDLGLGDPSAMHPLIDPGKRTNPGIQLTHEGEERLPGEAPIVITLLARRFGVGRKAVVGVTSEKWANFTQLVALLLKALEQVNGVDRPLRVDAHRGALVASLLWVRDNPERLPAGKFSRGDVYAPLLEFGNQFVSGEQWLGTEERVLTSFIWNPVDPRLAL